MPVYHYGCKNCGDDFETYRSIKADKLTTCTKCNSESLEIVIDGPFDMSVKEVKTIGQLAEQNSKKMGKELLQRKMESDGITAQQEKKEKMATMNKLASLTPEKQDKYIRTGKI